MIFDPPLVPGRLLRRYKRFLADVRLADGREVVAHCPNPGSMLSLIDEAEPEVWLTPHQDPRRKLQWTWELVRARGELVCINTQRPNALAERAILEGRVAELTGYERLRREVRYGTASRVDMLLEAAGRQPCYVEVKGVTMLRREGLAEFPDAVTKRGAKHLDELAQVARGGGRAVMLYLSPRRDGRRFRLAEDIDPGYAEAFRTARAAGVEAICYTCVVSTEAIYANDAVPVEID